jgi:hypothetical protein
MHIGVFHVGSRSNLYVCCAKENLGTMLLALHTLNVLTDVIVASSDLVNPHSHCTAGDSTDNNISSIASASWMKVTLIHVHEYSERKATQQNTNLTTAFFQRKRAAPQVGFEPICIMLSRHDAPPTEIPMQLSCTYIHVT